MGLYVLRTDEDGGGEGVWLGWARGRPARRPASAEVVRNRLDAVSLPSVWTAERAEQWWAVHRPKPRDARPVADVLLSHEGHELRIGPRVRARG
jgi:hypothetical protein